MLGRGRGLSCDSSLNSDSHVTFVQPVCVIYVRITSVHCYIDIQSEYVVCEWSYLLDLYHQRDHTSIEIENKSFTEFMFSIYVLVI